MTRNVSRAAVAMHVKELKGYAQNLAAMACSWRIAADFEALAELPDGEVVFDLVQATSTHSTAGVLNLGAACDLAAWLRKRLAAAGCDMRLLESAQVVLAIDTSSPPTSRRTIVPFRFISTAALAVDGRRYSAVENNFIWYNRPPNKPVQTDGPSDRR